MRPDELIAFEEEIAESFNNAQIPYIDGNQYMNTFCNCCT